MHGLQQQFARSTIACAALFATATSRSLYAQVPVTAIWQTSIDGGAHWQGGTITVGPSQSLVDVRVLIGWNGANLPPGATFVYDARFDGVIDNAGSGDAISDLLLMRAGLLRPPMYAITAQRMGTFLKIDGATDLALPGAGPFGISPDQNDIFQVPDMSNPLAVFSYRLTLDGTLGTRDITSAFNIFPQSTSPWVRIRASVPDQWVLATSLTQQPASIQVIPAPAGLVVSVVGFVVTMRRRRGLG